MLESFFDLPLLITGPAIIGALCLFALAGLIVVRRCILPRLRIRTEDSEFTGAMLQAVMVFYGLAVALIAVSVWQSYSDASKLISQEAAAIGALYRDVSLYPEPLRSELQRTMVDHLDHLIHEAWPLQRQGKVQGVKVETVKKLMQAFATFEPATEGQKLQHGETLHALNATIVATRLRVDAGRAALPGILWGVIVTGAVISLSSSFFFRVEDVRLHGILVTLLAVFMGLVIFMIFALDRPFRGDLGLGPEPYQLIYDQMIKRQ
jgi:hypothetical protein